MIVFKTDYGAPNSFSRAGQNIRCGGIGRSGWWCRARAGNASGCASGANRSTGARRSHTKFGGAVYTTATNGAFGRLRRAIEESGGYVCPAAGTQSGAVTTLQAQREIVHAQVER